MIKRLDIFEGEKFDSFLDYVSKTDPTFQPEDKEHLKTLYRSILGELLIKDKDLPKRYVSLVKWEKNGLTYITEDTHATKIMAEAVTDTLRGFNCSERGKCIEAWVEPLKLKGLEPTKVIIDE